MEQRVDPAVGDSAGTSALRNGPVHGLVVFKSLAWPRTGATRSLRLAAPLLHEWGTHLHFVAARSILHLFAGLLRVRRFRFDFVLFNGLASIARGSAGNPILTAFGAQRGDSVRQASWASWLSSRFHVGYRLGRLAQALGRTVFVYWHETDWVLDRHEREDPGGARRVARLASYPSTVHLTASERANESIRNRYPGVQSSVIYECSSVPPAFDEPVCPSDPPVVLNIASIQERKGTDLFVDTAIKVCQRHPRVEFIWLGEGRPFGTWQGDIDRAGLQHRILFPGYVEQAHLLLRRASVFFLSSRDDPFPLSVLEAMCLGRAIVAFDVGGAPEALCGLGQTIPPADTDAAAGAILSCLDADPTDLINLELRERYLEHYSPESFARRLDRVLRQHLGVAAEPGPVDGGGR